MTETVNHPTTERLQAFVEETLDEGRRASVAAHISVCGECGAEVEELRSLFGVLSGLHSFAPPVGFADTVMAKVRVRRPAFAWARVFAGAGAWIERLVPQTTRGWAMTAAVLALPVLGATLLVTWLMAQPGVTPQGLWTLGSSLAGDALVDGWRWAWTHFAGTTLAAWITQGAQLAQNVGRGEIGLAAVVFATLTAGSSYVLYQNLFRPEARRTEHATYVF